MRGGLLLLTVMCLAGCVDMVSSRYATLADARADRLFERGWLPDVLPPSSTRIQTHNDLDANTSYGEFHFPAAEGHAFFARLTPGVAPMAQVSDDVADYERRGYRSWRYTNEGGTWTFFCHPKKGVCDYRLWGSRMTVALDSP